MRDAGRNPSSDDQRSFVIVEGDSHAKNEADLAHVLHPSWQSGP